MLMPPAYGGGMEIIMKKKIISLKSVFLLVLAALMLSFSAHPAMAASASDNVNGKYVYFSAQNVIWKMQTTTGKCSRVKTFSGVGSVDDVTYHKGYLYFSTYTGGSDVGVSYVCRMKTSGKDYERLALGYNPAVCGDTIIYAYGAESEYDSYTEYLGIGSMEPDGSNSRLLVESTFDFWINPDFQILNDRIFFSGYSSEEGCYAIYSCDMDGDDMTADISKNMSNVSLFSDGTRLYISARVNDKQGLYVHDPKSDTTSKLMSLESKNNTNRMLVGAKNGSVYVSEYKYNNTRTAASGKLYKIDASNKKKSLVSKFTNGYCDRIQYAGKFFVAYQFFNSYYKNCGVVTFKNGGSKYKELSRYFIS